MRPAEFHGFNKIYYAPKDWDQDKVECTPLHVRISDKLIPACTTITSVWVPSDEERAQIAAGDNIKLTIVGNVMPPVMLGMSDKSERILDDEPFKDWRP